jgi:DNA-3-methyladenine glycosylase II
MMRCLRDKAAFPLEDVGLHNALKRQLQLEQKPTLAEIRKLALGWTHWEAYATFYLWKSLD